MTTTTAPPAPGLNRVPAVTSASALAELIVSALRNQAQSRSRASIAPFVGPDSTTSLQLAGRFDIELLAANILTATTAEDLLGSAVPC